MDYILNLAWWSCLFWHSLRKSLTILIFLGTFRAYRSKWIDEPSLVDELYRFHSYYSHCSAETFDRSTILELVCNSNRRRLCNALLWYRFMPLNQFHI